MEIKRHGVGARLSQAVEYGNLVFIAGQVADDTKADVKGQTQQILAKIDKLLADCGTNKSKLLWAQLWVTDPRNFPLANEIWDAWVEKGQTPVRAGLCNALANSEVKVEIMVTAGK